MTTELRIDEINVDGRHRHDLGDIKSLAASIDDIGLIHPPVVTPDHQLVAGERRLAAVRSLGWDTVPVTVIHTLNGLPDLLQAECDENTCRKDFTPTEAASIRKAVSAALAPVVEADRREAISASRRGDSGNLPSSRPKAQTRDVAAKGTGYSGRTLDKVDIVVSIADSPTVPEPVKVAAREAKAEMDATGNVSKAHQKVTDAQRAHDAVAEFPDLTFYAGQGRTADVIRLASALRGYAEPELSVRLDALRRTIAAERDGRLNQPKSDEPDYVLLANKMFVAANNAAQTIERNGGAETFCHAIDYADQLVITNWRSQFESLAATCAALAESCKTQLKVIR